MYVQKYFTYLYILTLYCDCGTTYIICSRHNPGEYMTAIDNWSALQIEGDMYTFIAREGKSGSCNGKPCGFVLKVDPESGEVEQTEIPSKGLVNDIIKIRYVLRNFFNFSGCKNKF